MNLASRFRLRGWRRWLAVALVALALFVFLFAACGRGEGEPTRPPAAGGAPAAGT